MLIINDQEYYQKVMDFAIKTNKIQNLKDKLNYLESYACQEITDNTQCTLYKDFAPYSFYFVMERKANDCSTEYERWFNGGLIFHGDHDGGGNGSGPTYSVCLEPTDGWSIHT